MCWILCGGTQTADSVCVPQNISYFLSLYLFICFFNATKMTFNLLEFFRWITGNKTWGCSWEWMEGLELEVRGRSVVEWRILHAFRRRSLIELCQSIEPGSKAFLSGGLNYVDGGCHLLQERKPLLIPNRRWFVTINWAWRLPIYYLE